MHPSLPHNTQNWEALQLLEAAFLRGPLLSSFMDGNYAANVRAYSFTVRHAIEIMSYVTGPTAQGHWLWGGRTVRGGAPSYRATLEDGYADDSTPRVRVIPAAKAVFDIVRGYDSNAELAPLDNECEKLHCVNPWHYREKWDAYHPRGRHLGPEPDEAHTWQVETIRRAAEVVAAEREKWPVLPAADTYYPIWRAWYEQSGLPLPEWKEWYLR